MQIKDITSKIIQSKIIETDKVPIHFANSKTFSTVTCLKPNSDKPRGLYLPDCDSLEALKYCELNMHDGFNRIKKMICTMCNFDEISFSVFSILHEFGHWIQYEDFIKDGHTDYDFFEHYEWKRILMYKQRNNEYKKCISDADVIALNTKYDYLYAELPTEKHANDFALSHLLEGVMTVK